MSADVIGGIAVIQRSRFWRSVRVYRLHLMLCHAAGHRSHLALCFTEGPPPPMIERTVGEPVWEFRRGVPRHGWLDCKPSVRQTGGPDGKTELFHNAGNWQVQYVEVIQQEPEMNQQRSQGDIDDAGKIHYELNFADMSFEQRAELFEELRQRGAIY